jgi:hypothetical protein
MLSHVSSTFHGRDVFAPSSAYLSLGARFSDLGPSVDDPVRLQDLMPRMTEELLEGRIIRFDHFGNAISNISIRALEGFVKRESFLITMGQMQFASLSKTYGEHPRTCLIGSSGYLEFGSFLGNFREQTGTRKGDPVTVRLR